MGEVLELVNESGCTEDFAKNLKSCLEYLRVESEEQGFEGTAYMLDIAIVTLGEDLLKAS